MTNPNITIEHRPAESRYVLLDGATFIGEEAYVDVTTEGGEQNKTTDRVMFHTEVSKKYAGQGLASLLVHRAVDEAITAGMKIVPVCPYVAKWLEQRAEYQKHVVKPTPSHLQAISAHQKA